PKAVRDSLLLRSHQYATFAGSKYYISSVLLTSPFQYDLFFTENEFVEAAGKLIPPVNGVSWNGAEERFEYTDRQIELSVFIVATKIFASGSEALGILERNNLTGSLRVNHHTSDPQTRVEPFDLIQGQITAYFYRKKFNSRGNRITITKAVHRQLYKKLKMTPADDDRAGDYQDLFLTASPDKSEEQLVIAACNNLRTVPYLGNYNENEFLWFVDFVPSKVYPRQPVKLVCDDAEYNLEINKLKAEPLPLPSEYDVLKIAKNDEINILITYALSRETDSKLLAGVISYLGSKGYYMNPISDIRRNVDTLSEFKRSFAKSDIFIPAAHLLDVNTFELGTDKSTTLNFTKTFKHKSGKKLKAKVTAYFPQKGSGLAGNLTRTDLANLLSERRRQLPHSLFVLTTSCNASDAIITWTNAYRDSLYIDIEKGSLKKVGDAKDLIHAIAPEGSFPTSAPSELLLDFIGPIEAVAIIMRGDTPMQVYEYLKEEIKPDMFIKTVRNIENLVTGQKKELDTIFFQPKYNLLEQNLLDQVGFDVKITR
ncbi:MAG: hypothetical protein HQK54_17045, partial [Oligoflexales bacterium]|nr:hypothetical protein [Oligoflexales bacterium]